MPFIDLLKLSYSTPKLKHCLEMYPYQLNIDFALCSMDPTVTLNIDFFKEVLQTFNQSTYFLAIDLTLFANFDGNKNQDEYQYYLALKETQFPKLKTIEFSNFTFEGEHNDFSFMEKVSEVSIRSNFTIRPDEFNLQKLFMATPYLNIVAFSRLNLFVGLCFLHIHEVQAVRIRNVVFTTPCYLSLFLTRQSRMTEFEFTFYPEYITWGEMNMTDAAKIAPVIYPQVAKLREINTLKIYAESSFHNKTIDMLKNLPKLVELKIVYSSLYSMGQIFQFLPKIISLKCLNVHECLMSKNSNRLNHSTLCKYLKLSPQIVFIKLNIENLLSCYVMDMKSALPYSSISVVFYRTQTSLKFYTLPNTPLRMAL